MESIIQTIALHCSILVSFVLSTLLPTILNGKAVSYIVDIRDIDYLRQHSQVEPLAHIEKRRWPVSFCPTLFPLFEKFHIMYPMFFCSFGASFALVDLGRSYCFTI